MLSSSSLLTKRHICVHGPIREQTRNSGMIWRLCQAEMFLGPFGKRSLIVWFILLNSLLVLSMNLLLFVDSECLKHEYGRSNFDVGYDFHIRVSVVVEDMCTKCLMSPEARAATAEH